MDRSRTGSGYDWARRFDEQARQHMVTDPSAVARLDGHGDFRLAVPTPDHFIPLLYLAGLAGRAGDRPAEVLVDGYAYGSLSMTAYTLDVHCPPGPGAAAGAPELPSPVPPDESNI